MIYFLPVMILSFLSFSVFAKLEEKAEKPPLEEEESNFVPSLTEALNNTNRLKTEIKRQLAEEFSIGSEQAISGRSPKGEKDSSSDDQVAQFGDLEVRISERGEEELVRVKDEAKE